MLMLFTWASLMFVAPPPAQTTAVIHGPTQVQHQDSSGRKKPEFSPNGPSPQERPPFRQNAPPSIFLNAQEDQRPFAGIVDSLLKANPLLRTSFLKGLLIPSGSLPVCPPATKLDSVSLRLTRDNRISSFERMGLIARRYEITNPNPHAYSTHQIDVIGTVLWLNQVLK